MRRFANGAKPTLGARMMSGHPLTPDRAAFVFNERAGTVATDQRLLHHGTLTSSSFLTWSPSGLTGDNPSADRDFRVRLASDPVSGLGACSIVLWVNVDNTSASRGFAGAFTDNSNTSALLFSGTDNLLRLRVNGGTDAISTATLPSGSFTDVWIAGTYDGATSRVYINGKEEGSASVSGTIGVGTPPAFDLMQYAGSAGTSMHGTVYLCYVYGRALGAGELRRLMVEPYAPFAGLSRRWLDGPAGAVVTGWGPLVGHARNRLVAA